ncbi:MAG: GGDEF domain-containing protein [Oscillospiraceae bacterium]|nr:GGDEF domain-containing protein [Oscillospiraceae bacterium]
MKDRYNIAICIPRLDDQVQRDIVNSIMTAEVFSKCTFSVLSTYSDMFTDNDITRGESSIFSLINFITADVLLVFPERFYLTNILDKILSTAKEKHIPVISIGGFIHNTPSISFGIKQSFRNIISHLIEEHGCKRINFIAGRKDEAEHDERLIIFKETLTEHGIPIEEERIGFGEYWDNPTVEVLEKFLNSNLERPEAIVCANDVMALTTVNYLKAKGIRVPQDVLVTGFDGIDIEKYHSPRLTTSSINTELLCSSLYEYITKICDGDILPLCHTIEFSERFSESCGCNNKTDEIKPFLTLWKELTSDSSFNDSIIQMISKIDIVESITDILSTVSRFLDYVFSTEIRVCVSDDYIKSIWNGVPYEFNGFSDTMFSVVEKVDNGKAIVYDDRTFDTGKLVPDESRPRRLILYPLHYKDTVFGYVAANSALNHIALHQIRTFSMNLGYVLERIATYKLMESINSRLEAAYIYDSMTGLLSRNGYYTMAKKKLEPELGGDKHIVIISVDLDNLKEINDRYGHHSGDTAIKIIAHTLQEYVGDDGIAARFGGDEFVGIKVFDISTDKFVHDFSEGFACTIADKVEESELEYNISASFGIVSVLAKTLPSLEEGIKSADVLMYAQKRAKQKNFRLR